MSFVGISFSLRSVISPSHPSMSPSISSIASSIVSISDLLFSRPLFLFSSIRASLIFDSKFSTVSFVGISFSLRSVISPSHPSMSPSISSIASSIVSISDFLFSNCSSLLSFLITISLFFEFFSVRSFLFLIIVVFSPSFSFFFCTSFASFFRAFAISRFNPSIDDSNSGTFLNRS